MKEVALKKDLMKVTLKDNRVLYFPAEKYPAFLKSIKADAFIEIEGVLINRNFILIVEPEKIEHDILLNLPVNTRMEAKQKFTAFKSRLGRWPTDTEQQKIVNKLLSE